MRLCGWCNSVQERRCRLIEHVSMPHAALWVVQQPGFRQSQRRRGTVSMPHAALWVVQQTMNDIEFDKAIMFQCRTRLCGWCNMKNVNSVLDLVFVSMPHAALWVVQQLSGILPLGRMKFQCRTRLCGWCNRIARSPCPPMGKKPFWKVSGNLRCLTENI